MQIPFFNTQKETNNLIVSIAIDTSGLSVVAIKKSDATWHLESATTQALTPSLSIEKQISDVLSQWDKQQCAVTLTLAQEAYHVVQTDKPDVPENDIIEALPWLLGDVVPFDASNIVLDYVDYPVKQRSGNQKIDVFAANKAQLSSLVGTIEKHKSKHLKHIHVKEVLVSDMLPDDDYARLIIVQEPSSEPFIMIVRAKHIWLARRLRGYLPRLQEDTDLTHVADSLGLEIQRSMDFYESQLKQPPIKEALFKTQFDCAPVIERLKPFQPVHMAEFIPELPLADVVSSQCHFALASAFYATGDAE
jgi:MSHA biogenesis protein MshI